MGRYNLVEENWINVIVDEKGTTKKVSLNELFENANEYIDLAGDSKTQDFAVLRILLAILHTVFSRFDADGNPYEVLELEDGFRQTKEVDEDDFEEYVELLTETWENLWEMKKFPKIVNEYLEFYKDRFYLFDEKYPFMQVKASDVASEKINKNNPTEMKGKTINRLVSESKNSSIKNAKYALFSPKYNLNENSSFLEEDEIARWLITYHGFTSTTDKVKFLGEDYSASIGWLFNLGGVYIKGKNLYDTLILNLVLVHPENQYIRIQRPSWEKTTEDNVSEILNSSSVNNLAQLYTQYSRAIYIEPFFNITKPFSFYIVKLPGIEIQNNFLELMTLWEYKKTGEYKDKFTPKKHNPNVAMWRNFGLLTIPNMSNANNRRPGIIDWFYSIEDIINYRELEIQAVTMKDDGNSKSMLPVDEVIDSLKIYEEIFTDVAESGWIPRINDAITETKEVVEGIYYRFLTDIKVIRNIESNEFQKKSQEELYFLIDAPFRQWLLSINPYESKDEKILEWRKKLYKITIQKAEELLKTASPRDYKGIVVKDKTKNIATSYNSFIYNLNKKLEIKKEEKDGE